MIVQDKPSFLVLGTESMAAPPTAHVPANASRSTPSHGSYLPSGGAFTIPPATALALKAVVKDSSGLVKPGISVTLKLSVSNGTGGHVHTINRPAGGLSCNAGPIFNQCPSLTTGNNGEAPFDFHATPVSGIHSITATCSGCNSQAHTDINVKVESLIPIPSSSRYALTDLKGVVIGAVPLKHTANHFLTSASITKLKALADLYMTINPGAKLYLNDASLEWGGLFDVGSTPWSSPHSLHDQGRSLDIRAENNGLNNEGAIPAKLFKKFLEKAGSKKIRVGLHCKNSSDTNYCFDQPNNRHFHVDF